MIKQYSFHKTKYGDELLIDLIALENLEPYIAESPVHSLTYYDITLIASGHGTFSIDQNTVPVEKKRIFFSSPGQVRQWNFSAVPHGYVLIFEEEFLCSFFNDTQFIQNLSYFGKYDAKPSIVLTTDEYSQVLPLMQNIKNEICRYQIKDKHILRALLYQVLTMLNRIYTSHFPASDSQEPNRHVQQFIRLVNCNYRDKRSVNFYAGELNITPGHLNDLSKKCTGMSAKQHILNRTMLEAKRLLNYSGLSVDEIAAHLNYENTSYFVRAFRRYTNETPLRFRKNKIHEK